MQENLEAYVKGQFNASARRVLFTKWVGQAWGEICQNRDMIVRSFQKTGIAVVVDGSEDSLIRIEWLEDYSVEDIDTDQDTLGHEDTDEDPLLTVKLLMKTQTSLLHQKMKIKEQSYLFFAKYSIDKLHNSKLYYNNVYLLFDLNLIWTRIKICIC